MLVPYHDTTRQTEDQAGQAEASLPSFDVNAEPRPAISVKQIANGPQTNANDVTAHELHNLIAIIIAEAQLLQLAHPERGPDHASAVAIERAGRRLEALVDRFAAPSKDLVPIPDRGDTDVEPAFESEEAIGRELGKWH